MKEFAVDYETYYDKDCSIQKGLDSYLTHPDFDAYMVSIFGDDGFCWVGPPKEAPWDALDGGRVLAHNRNFDEPVHEFLVNTGKIPQTNFAEWHCTADMSSHHGWGRSLKEALKNSVGVHMKKDIRDAMKGRKYDDLEDDEKSDLAKYAMYDSKGCLTLWKEGKERWLPLERKLSRETTRMCRQGLPMDLNEVDHGISHLKGVLERAIDTLPWATEQHGALSPQKLGEWCRKRGVEPPASTAKDRPDVIKWIQDNPEEGKVLEAMHTLRGSNMLLSKVKKMKSSTGPDGRMPFPMKYFGGHTGRDSGGSDSEKGDSFNVQNLPRGKSYGFNLRGCIAAPAGKVLLIADLAQIEARCAMWLAGETEMLDVARQGGMDWYEAMARSFGLYTGTEPLKVANPKLRHTMKQQSLGCQYRMGVGKFASVSGIEFEDAQSMVRMFRANVPKLVRLWSRLEREMRSAGREDPNTYVVGLPSGREMHYLNVMTQHGLSAEVSKYGKRMREKFWSGKIMENITQAFARDVFMDRVIALVEGGHNIILRVHDEVLIETDKDNAEEAARDVHNIMTTSPDWCKSLPLGTEVEIEERYKK